MNMDIKIIKYLFHSISALSILSIAVTTDANTTTHKGEGTFYGYGGGGNCSFPVPNHILTAAMNATDYANSDACGGVIVVTNVDTGMSVTVRIDDQCPECAVGDIDLDKNAFAQIANITTGRIPINWHYVANDQAGNIKLYFKEGSSQWWTGIQVRDHRYPISKLEYRITGSGKDHISVSREPYNYFVAPSGFGVGPYDFRITDFRGQIVKAGGISLALGSEIDTGAQFSDDIGGGNTEGDDTGNSDGGDPQASAETTLSTINKWDTGYCAAVTVTNPNRTSIIWDVSLVIQGTISNLWNAKWSQTDTVLTASGMSWNATLDSGASTEFGFCVNR